MALRYTKPVNFEDSLRVCSAIIGQMINGSVFTIYRFYGALSP